MIVENGKPCQRGRKCFVRCPECRDALTPVHTVNTPQGSGAGWMEWSAPADHTCWDVLPGTGHDDLVDVLGFTSRYSPIVPRDKMLAVQPGKITMFDLAEGPGKTVACLVDIGPDGKMRIVHVKDITDD